MLNSAVSLGRTGMSVSFIGECGADKTGDIISDFLGKNSVDHSYLKQQKEMQTTISMAFLDENNEASYSFYKSPPVNINRVLPQVNTGDILLFGSYYSLSEFTGTSAFELVKYAAGKGAILFYDPNFRRPHLHRLKELKPLIERNIKISNIVRGSHEDFELIFGTRSARETWELDCFRGNKVLIYTAGGKEISVFTPAIKLKFSVPKINPVSTIGAGDSFNAGVIKAIIETGNLNTLISELHNWEPVIEKGIKFARAACLSHENFVPEGFDKY